MSKRATPATTSTPTTTARGGRAATTGTTTTADFHCFVVDVLYIFVSKYQTFKAEH